MERCRAGAVLVDIMECEIHRYALATGEHQILQFPEEVGCFSLREKGGFIVALRSAIWLADGRGLLVHKICDNPSNPQLARFNDGGADRDGRFYASTFYEYGRLQQRCWSVWTINLSRRLFSASIFMVPTAWHSAKTSAGCTLPIRRMP